MGSPVALIAHLAVNTSHFSRYLYMRCTKNSATSVADVFKGSPTEATSCRVGLVLDTPGGLYVSVL